MLQDAPIGLRLQPPRKRSRHHGWKDRRSERSSSRKPAGASGIRATTSFRDEPPQPASLKNVRPRFPTNYRLSRSWSRSHSAVFLLPEPPRYPRLVAGPRLITNVIGMSLTLVPSGEFQMGSRESADDTAVFFNKTYGGDALTADFFNDEHPQHRVRITRAILPGDLPCHAGPVPAVRRRHGLQDRREEGREAGRPTAGTPIRRSSSFNDRYPWRNPGFAQADDHPAVNVSWNDVLAFCQWLSGKESKNYRLPTEAEWEYACRAGTTTRYYNGDDPKGLAKVGNVADATFKAKFVDWKYAIKASDGYVFHAPVGSFQPNAFGLYDMHGNAWQWCAGPVRQQVLCRVCP